jgi:hypothetical protein
MISGITRLLKNIQSTVDLGKITTWNLLRWLIADTNLESSWAPVDELNGALGLESGNSSVNILWNNISTIEQAGGHILSALRITFNHLVMLLEARHGDFLNRVLLVRGLGWCNDWSIGNQWEVNTRIWDKVGLELV